MRRRRCPRSRCTRHVSSSKAIYVAAAHPSQPHRGVRVTRAQTVNSDQVACVGLVLSGHDVDGNELPVVAWIDVGPDVLLVDFVTSASEFLLGKPSDGQRSFGFSTVRHRASRSSIPGQIPGQAPHQGIPHLKLTRLRLAQTLSEATARHMTIRTGSGRAITDHRDGAADAPAERDARVSTGIPALDQIRRGGLVAGRAYLVRSGPGSGETTNAA